MCLVIINFPIHENKRTFARDHIIFVPLLFIFMQNIQRDQPQYMRIAHITNIETELEPVTWIQFLCLPFGLWLTLISYTVWAVWALDCLMLMLVLRLFFRLSREKKGFLLLKNKLNKSSHTHKAITSNNSHSQWSYACFQRPWLNIFKTKTTVFFLCVLNLHKSVQTAIVGSAQRFKYLSLHWSVFYELFFFRVEINNEINSFFFCHKH